MAGSPEYDIPGFVYASLVTAGGLMGFIKRGSVASLVAGGGSGLIAGWGAYRVSHNPKDVRVSLAVAVILTLLMGKRFIASGKFMPAGLVTALSIIMVVRYGMRLQ
ncbi:uncharacterized protein CcaverHIS019_0603910 [Cutaneotrichosporon cavernicola]|uniref:Transmembrane protein 14C n=1 Tax=Cutaneotrichosporon cavernicola TaxID=279322 RepID=A0AA48QXZ6_9TREE|nr:uncharacterized protein CcaverHIS019_0603910 [Cutaneotrichosporon cavernicola]BEI93932.1 hypothetical protein CcaverHIS019_0603910 [Cutaneotrichosporon cavernicola]BEJ01710.1 hypothetical protein CcaverHIS631_0603920 [Cutaneotrichosporon cavernicola]BEJ09477.1 hypothetical protein CcaverHIS641_0603920 [Cutaneotrichosporon cavernicola]